MNSLIKNKKSVLFFSVVLAILFVFIFIPWAVNTSRVKESKFGNIMGESQLLLLRTFQRGEKVLLFIDESSKLALQDSLFELAESGGLDNAECDSYKGYNYWKNEEQECYPEDIDNALVSVFETNLEEYFEIFSESIPSIEYDYEIKRDDDDIELIAKSQEKLKMEISEENVFNFETSSFISDGGNQNESGDIPEIEGGFSIGRPVSQGWGVSSCYKAVRGENKYHHGIDITVTGGTDVKAVADGKVIYAGSGGTDYNILNWAQYGTRVILEHKYNNIRFWTLYAHLDSFNVREGQNVKRGEIIAQSDNSGSSTGDHLHFEIRVLSNSWDTAINPLCIHPNYLDGYSHSCTADVGCEVQSGVYRSFTRQLQERQVAGNIITGSVVSSPQTTQGEQEILETYPQQMQCSDLSGTACNTDQSCTGYSIKSSDTNTCCIQGNCVDKELYEYEGESCSDYFYETCSEDEVCSGEEVYLNSSGQFCCVDGTCENKVQEYPDLDLSPEPDQRNYSGAFIAVAIIVILLVLIYYFRKNKIISISLFAIIIISGFLLTPTLKSPSENKITGHVVETREQQMEYVCQIAEKYEIPGSTLLSIAYKESSINHYENGEVKISADGGVGMMQVDRGDPEDIPDGPYYVCGDSSIDGRRLDAKKLKDNIECGAKEIIGKCDSLNCGGNTKEYYCPNTNNPLPPKRVEYSGWDIAIRAYNGWGCEAPYFRNLWGPNNPKYINLITRVQSYVEDFHETEEQFKDVCGGDYSLPPQEKEIIGIPEEIQNREKIGFYYLNPSFRVSSSFDNELYESTSKRAQELYEQMSSCSGPLYLCARTNAPNNWEINCDEAQRTCMFDVDTGQELFVYDDDTEEYSKKEVAIKFALKFPLDLPDSPLSCPVDSNLGYFTVGDTNNRHYSQCVSGENEDVLNYVIEGFSKYDNLEDISYTPLLFITQCFVETSSGADGCIQSLPGGICQVDRCPEEYPNCRENSEEGKRQNILAALKLLDENTDKIMSFQRGYDLSERQMIELLLFSYNRGIGTVYGFDYNSIYIKGVRDYLSEGESLRDSMLQACYNAYDAGAYGECGGSRDWCCSSVGGISYVYGTISEYESNVCKTAERVVSVT